MTGQRYQTGCAAESKEMGGASPSDYAFYVNFNNGNVNWNNQNNNGFVRACRRVPASECQDAARVELRDLIHAWKEARRGKVPSLNQTGFDANWADNLLTLQEQLNAGTWAPKPSICFIATAPKAREIHAPDFSDRVVHHLVIPKLEAIFEPKFIFDSFANRVGKGTHEAVNRLKGFFREVHSGHRGGYFLQLDIRNFFNTIHRPTLYKLLKAQMEKAGLPLLDQRVIHALLRRSPLKQGVVYRATTEERAAVPPHKRLENAAPGCGLPIGNLSSQFFANVYLNELDQFVKHVLKAKRYLRYVDDFVLVHESREQLEAWKGDIERFLAERLRLRLKNEVRLAPLTEGCDFLGYVIHPTHTTVRPRVIQHAREKLWAFQQRHAANGALRVTPEAYDAGRAIWASYQGHFAHASSHRLTADFHHRFPWLRAFQRRRRFDHSLAGQPVAIHY